MPMAPCVRFLAYVSLPFLLLASILRDVSAAASCKGVSNKFDGCDQMQEGDYGEDTPEAEVSLLQHNLALGRDVVNGQPLISMLHIGKTGGTSIRDALKDSVDDAKFRILGHDESADFMESRRNGSSAAPLSKDIVLFVRSPVHRYVSAWISNYRRVCDPQEDKNCVRWEEVEEGRMESWSSGQQDWYAPAAQAVKDFPTPDVMACSLSSDDAKVAKMATKAMERLGHVYRGISHYVGGLEGAKKTLSQILLVGKTEHLQEDYERLLSLLAARRSFVHDPPPKIPQDHSTEDMNPELKMLGRCAVQNLHKYYSEDYQVIRLFADEGLVDKSYLDEVHTRDAAPPEGQRLSY